MPGKHKKAVHPECESKKGMVDAKTMPPVERPTAGLNNPAGLSKSAPTITIDVKGDAEKVARQLKEKADADLALKREKEAAELNAKRDELNSALSKISSDFAREAARRDEMLRKNNAETKKYIERVDKVMEDKCMSWYTRDGLERPIDIYVGCIEKFLRTRRIDEEDDAKLASLIPKVVMQCWLKYVVDKVLPRIVGKTGLTYMITDDFVSGILSNVSVDIYSVPPVGSLLTKIFVQDKRLPEHQYKELKNEINQSLNDVNKWIWTTPFWLPIRPCRKAPLKKEYHIGSFNFFLGRFERQETFLSLTRDTLHNLTETLDWKSYATDEFKEKAAFLLAKYQGGDVFEPKFSSYNHFKNYMLPEGNPPKLCCECRDA